MEIPVVQDLVVLGQVVLEEQLILQHRKEVMVEQVQ
jgi:hypothetical protein